MGNGHHSRKYSFLKQGWCMTIEMSEVQRLSEGSQQNEVLDDRIFLMSVACFPVCPFVYHLFQFQNLYGLPRNNFILYTVCAQRSLLPIPSLLLREMFTLALLDFMCQEGQLKKCQLHFPQLNFLNSLLWYVFIVL